MKQQRQSTSKSLTSFVPGVSICPYTRANHQHPPHSNKLSPMQPVCPLQYQQNSNHHGCVVSSKFMFTLQNSEACRGVSNLLQQVASCFAAWRIPLIVDVSFLHMSYLLYKVVQVFTADKLVFPRYTHQEKTSCMVVHSISSSSAQGRGLLKT